MAASDNLGPQFQGFDPTTANYEGTAHHFGYTDNGEEQGFDRSAANFSGQEEALSVPNPKYGERPVKGGMGKLMDTKPFVPNETLTQNVKNYASKQSVTMN